MAHRNSKCNHCEEVYHYCRSCDLPEQFYEEFCSYECWTKSKEYIDFMNIATVFYYSLDDKQTEMFEKILDHVNYIDDSGTLMLEFKNKVGI